MLQAVIFDADGTLLKSEERQFNWLKHWADQKNKKFPFRDLKKFLKFYNDECAKKGGVQNVYNALDLPCKMNDKKHEVWDAYRTFCNANPVELYPGIKQAVLKIHRIGHLSEDYKRTRRLRMGINTTNLWKNVYPALKKNNILRYIDFQLTKDFLSEYEGSGNSNYVTKPSKISLACSLDLADSQGEFTIHIGDTVNDLAASQKVVRLNPMHPETLITVGVAWGYEGKERLEKGVETESGTIYFNRIVDKPSQLVKVIEYYFNQ